MNNPSNKVVPLYKHDKCDRTPLQSFLNKSLTQDFDISHLIGRIFIGFLKIIKDFKDQYFVSDKANEQEYLIKEGEIYEDWKETSLLTATF